jgi:hypothetical protein
MRRTLFAATFVVAALALAGLAWADPSDVASTHVFVNVVPNISISPSAATVDLGTIQTGAFGTGITFRVDANTEAVRFMAGVSRLYKGNDPAGTEVTPIDVSGGGVTMTAESANPIGGRSNIAMFMGDLTDILGTGFMGRQTEWVTFESSQNGHFSQSITLTPTWSQPDPEKPLGEYSGVVALWAMVVPSDS